MTTNRIEIVIAVCLVVLQQGVKAQFLYPNCGLSHSPEIRIGNGRNTSPGSAPFMAYVMKNNTYHCGGSIINQRYILTAAHCLDADLSVRLGEYDDRTDPDCEGMVCIPRHEDFGIDVALCNRQYDNFAQNHDIALLRLDRDIIFRSHIQPICLYLYPASVPRVADYQVFGWGWINRHGATAHVLRTTNLRRYLNGHCNSPFRTLTRNQICAGSEEWNLYNGVSGSPLLTKIFTNDKMNRFVQLGVVSTGGNGSGAFTYVPNYVSWILNTMRAFDLKF